MEKAKTGRITSAEYAELDAARAMRVHVYSLLSAIFITLLLTLL